MKTSLKLLAGLIVIISINNSAIAQNMDLGDTPDECKRQISYLKFGVDGNDMESALNAWRKIIEICPQASPNTYGVWGTAVLEHMIKNAKSADEKSKYIDTLMMNYDYRIQYFPLRFKADDVAFRKANSLIEYAPERYEQITELIEKYLEVAKDNADPGMVPLMFQQTKLMFEKKQKEVDDVMNAYDKAMAIIDAKLAKKSGDEALLKAKADVEGIFITIPEFSSCDNLIAIYEPRFRANPTDKNLLEKLLYLLESNKCQESPLYSEVAEALYAADPSVKAAMVLATLFMLKEENDKVVEYMGIAIDAESNNTEKSKIEVQLANFYLAKMDNQSQALKYARAALSNDPTNAPAQTIIASIYAQMAGNASRNGSCGEFDSKAIFWVVIDAYNKAKQLDPSIASEVNKSINQYSQYTPTKEDVFMNGLSEGASYTVNCGGIGGTTIIRGR